MLKFTPKITNTRVIQYQDIIFAKWQSLAQILLLLLYSPVAFWLFDFLVVFGTVSKTYRGVQAFVGRVSEPLSMVLMLFWVFPLQCTAVSVQSALTPREPLHQCFSHQVSAAISSQLFQWINRCDSHQLDRLPCLISQNPAMVRRLQHCPVPAWTHSAAQPEG